MSKTGAPRAGEILSKTELHRKLVIVKKGLALVVITGTENI